MLIFRFKKWIAEYLINKGYDAKEVMKYSRLSKSTVYRMRKKK